MALLSPFSGKYLPGSPNFGVGEPPDYSTMSDEQAMATAQERAERQGLFPVTGGFQATQTMGAFQTYMAYKGLKALAEKPVPFVDITREQALQRARGWTPAEIATYEQRAARRSTAAYRAATDVGGGSLSSAVGGAISAQNIIGAGEFVAKGAELKRSEADKIMAQENLRKQQELEYRILQEKAYGGALAQGQQNIMQGLMGKSAAETQLLSSYISTAGQVAGMAMAMSDIRLKKDISFLGKIKEMNIYSFRYLWSDDLNVGVMAQEVEMIRPDCVIEINGYKAVNYSKLFL